MDERDLEILKELSETEDCSIHWNSTYNIVLRKAYEILKNNK